MNKRLLSLLILVLAVIMPMKLWAQEPYAVLSEDSTVLTFYYDDQKAARNGMSVGPFSGYPDDYQSWFTQRESITTAIFDPSFANCASITSTAFWFRECNQLTTISGISNLNTSNVTDMSYMFCGCSGLTSLDVSNFNTSKVKDMGSMFSGCSSLTSLDVSNFNTANVTDMGSMFSGCSGLTSLDVSTFNTANVTDISWMFCSCSGLTSLDLSHFNTEKVTNMSWMFYGCSGLTSLDVSNFKTDNVTDMYVMFYNCSGLTSLDVSGFNTSNVTNMSNMFEGCSNLTSLDLSNFNTANVTNMRSMFSGCSGLTSLDVSGFNTDNVTNMSWLFRNCSALPSLNVSGFNTANVTDMSDMFWSCSGLTSLDISNFNTNNVTDMYGMFAFCSGLTSLNVSSFNTANVTNMGDMFWYCSGLTSLDLSNFNTANVTDMGNMFSGCSGLTSLDVSNFNTANVTDMGYMFEGCSGLTSLDVSNFKTGQVTNMWSMFSGCSKLTNLDVSHFNTANVTNMAGMFRYCSGLTSLDLSSFNTSKVTYDETAYLLGIGSMFEDCSKLTTIFVGEDWTIANLTESADVFKNCVNLIGGKGTAYDSLHVDYTYARIDGGPNSETPGYFTRSGDAPYVAPEPYAVLSQDSLTVTFYYDDQKSARGGFDINDTIINDENGDVISPYGTATTAVFDASFADYRPTSTAYWFISCHSLTSIKGIENLKTDNVTLMHAMFAGCEVLNNLDVSGFKTDNVVNMDWMFMSCASLTSLDLSSFNTAKVTNMSSMFGYCYDLKTIYASSDWSTAAVTSGDAMFTGCTSLVGGAGTAYDENHADYTYAHIDGGPDNPGYLTKSLSLGDANGDGDVNIADAVVTVTSILGQPIEGNFYRYAADMNNDSEIDIFDVSMIVSNVLGAKTPAPALTRGNIDHVPAEAIRLTADANHIYMDIDQAQQYTAFQFDMSLPEGMSLDGVKLASGITDHQVSFVKRSENEYRVVGLSLSNEVLRSADGHLIQLQVSNTASEDHVKVSNVLFVTPAGKTVTGIDEHLNTTMTTDGNIYNLKGEKLGLSRQQLGKGIYIMNHKKVIFK